MAVKWQFPSGDRINVISKPCLTNFCSFDKVTKNILQRRCLLSDRICCKSAISFKDIHLETTKFVIGFWNFTLYIEFFLILQFFPSIHVKDSHLIYCFSLSLVPERSHQHHITLSGNIFKSIAGCFSQSNVWHDFLIFLFVVHVFYSTYRLFCTLRLL